MAALRICDLHVKVINFWNFSGFFHAFRIKAKIIIPQIRIWEKIVLNFRNQKRNEAPPLANTEVTRH